MYAMDDKVPIMASVCTGAAVLSKCGFLDGLPATTNHSAFSSIEAHYGPSRSGSKYLGSTVPQLGSERSIVGLFVGAVRLALDVVLAGRPIPVRGSFAQPHEGVSASVTELPHFTLDPAREVSGYILCALI